MAEISLEGDINYQYNSEVVPRRGETVDLDTEPYSGLYRVRAVRHRIMEDDGTQGNYVICEVREL